MKSWMLLLMACCLSGSAGAESAPQKNSQFSAQVFEKEDSASSFTSQTKIIREIQGETQVLFTDQKGFFTLNTGAPSAGSWQNLLTLSQTKKIKVKVTFDPDSRQILGVSRGDE